MDSGVSPDARKRGSVWQIWRLYPRQRRESRQEIPQYREGKGAGSLGLGSQSWSRTLENNAFGRIHETVGTSQGARLQGASVTWPGGTGRRRQWHHSGLWCDIFTTELDVEEGWTAGH